MLQRLVIFLVILITTLGGQAQESPPVLLAFALVERGSLQSNPYGFTETIYLYSPQEDTLQAIGTGDAIRWSPTGRYLAMADTVSEDPTAGRYFGQMRNFSVYDFEMETLYTREDYSAGDFITWSPDETYIVAGGSVSSGVGGANAWVDFFHPDGSGDLTGTHLGYVDGIMGSRGGISPIGWVFKADGVDLLVRDIGISRDDYVLMSAAAEAHTIIEGDLPPYTPFQRTWGDIGTAQSPDHRYAAVTRVAHVWKVDEDFSTYLLIVDMNTGETHEVTLPVSTNAIIARMAWRPCDLNSYLTECFP